MNNSEDLYRVTAPIRQQLALEIERRQVVKDDYADLHQNIRWMCEDMGQWHGEN